MLKFITSAFAVTAFCSIIKFSLSLGLMRFISPNEFAEYAVVVIFWGFIEIFVEKGTQALTIKNGISASKIQVYMLDYAKIIIKVMMLMTVLLLFAVYLNLYSLNVTSLAIFILIGLGTLIKLFVLLFEANNINRGKYTQTQFKDLFATSIAYIAAISIIDRFQFSGSIILSVVFFTQPLLYGILYYDQIYYVNRQFRINLNFKIKIEDIELDKHKEEELFKKNVVQSAVYEYITTKLDELTAFLIFSNTVFGTYLKFKEISSTVAGFGSRVISRPWFYACVQYNVNEVKKYLLLITILLAVVMIFGLCIPSEYYQNVLIIILGSNWENLATHGKILYQFACVTFIYIFLKYTMSGLGAQSRQTLIDARIFKITILNLILFAIIKLYTEIDIALNILIFTLIAIKIIAIYFQLISLGTILMKNK